jgi:hypothetical protein
MAVQKSIFTDLVAMAEIVAQLEAEQSKIIAALPVLHERLSAAAREEYAQMTEASARLGAQLGAVKQDMVSLYEANKKELAQYGATLTAVEANFARFMQESGSVIPALV